MASVRADHLILLRSQVSEGQVTTVFFGRQPCLDVPEFDTGLHRDGKVRRVDILHVVQPFCTNHQVQPVGRVTHPHLGTTAPGDNGKVLPVRILNHFGDLFSIFWKDHRLWGYIIHAVPGSDLRVCLNKILIKDFRKPFQYSVLCHLNTPFL